MSSEQEIAASSDVIKDTFAEGAVVSPIDLARSVLAAAERVRTPKAFNVEGAKETRALHRARAVQTIAEHRCSTDLTNGFCGPSNGVCRRGSESGRDCIAEARGIVRALESRGMAVIWEYDPTLYVCMEKRS
jgi:hypothetical protein